MGLGLIARGASPWYAGAITLEYNAALNRAEVPLPGVRVWYTRDWRCLPFQGQRSPWLLNATPFGVEAWGKVVLRVSGFQGQRAPGY